MLAVGQGRTRALALARRLGMRTGPPRARTWLDLLWVAWLAWILDAINNLGAVRQGLAEHNARGLLDLERGLHLAPELSTNLWLTAHHALSEIVVFYYTNAHAAITFVVIGWLWWRRPDILSPLRATLIIVNLIGLAVFWTFPLAPPRMLTSIGYVDLVAAVHHVPVWRGGATALEASQLSSFPSLHIAWAVWSAIVVWRICPRAWVRTLALIYPLATTWVVMATANHFLADAVIGALITVLVTLAVDRFSARRRPRATRRAHPTLAPEPAPGRSG